MIALIVWSVDNNLLLFDGQMTTFYKLAIDHRAKDTMSLQETFFQPIFLLSGGPEFSTFLQFKFSSDIEMCLNAILSDSLSQCLHKAWRTDQCKDGWCSMILL